MLSDRDIELPAAKRAEFNRHLGGCRYCQSVVDEYSEIGGIIKSLPPHVEPSAELENRTVAAMVAALAEQRATTDRRSDAEDQAAVRRRGVGGLEDQPKPGKPRVIDDVPVVLATLEPPPERLGVTHWSSRLLAAELGISNVKVADVWREWGLQPWRAESFTFSTDPVLEAKVRDVIGLYLNPPDKAVVLCVDEKPQTQALERKAPRGPASRKSAATTTSGTAPPRCSRRWRPRPAK